ncbi:MAG: hypothetical protein J5689_01560 [Clostridia bacterium]|nr:hypothetical protein [Clostridia bacterium]
MNFLLSNIRLLLEQTAKEQNLTVLYLGIFLFLMAILVVDIFGLKMFAANKTINKIILVIVLIAFVSFIVAYFVMVK